MAGKSITNKVMFKIVVDAGGFKQDMNTLNKTAAETQKVTKSSLGNIGNAARNAGMAMTLGITVPLVAIGKQALQTGMDFEQGMANIQAVTEASAIEMANFEKLIRDIAKKTPYSTKQIAEAVEELSKAGLTSAQILNGALYDSLTLAAAGGIDLAESANLAARALITFSKDGLTVKQAADIIVGAANKSTTSVGELGSSFEMVAVVASTAGMTLKDVATGLAVFAQNGMAGSDAGTSLKTMLMNLQPQSTKAAKVMKELGLVTADGKNQFYDMNGEMKDLAGIAEVVQKAFTGMGTEQRMMAMRTIFGMDAIRGANVLYKEGAAGINAMAASIKSVNAQEVAEKKWDTLANKWKRFTNVLADFAITVSKDVIPMLTNMVEGATDFAKGFSKIPKPLRDVVLLFGALAAVAGPLLLIFGSVAGAIANIQVLLAAVGSSAFLASVGTALATALPIIGLAVVALGGLAIAYRAVEKDNKRWTTFLEKNQKPLLQDANSLLKDYRKETLKTAEESSKNFNKLAANAEGSLTKVNMALGDSSYQQEFLDNIKIMSEESKSILKKSFDTNFDLVSKYLAKYDIGNSNTEAGIVATLISSNQKKVEEVEKAYADIEQIVNKSLVNSEKLSQEEIALITKKMDTIRKLTSKELQKTSLESALIEQDMRDKSGKASLKAYKEFQKVNAEKTAVTVSNAKLAAGEELAALDYMVSEGVITYEDYHRQKEATVNRYKEVVKSAQVEELNGLVQITNNLKSWKKEMESRLAIVIKEKAALELKQKSSLKMSEQEKLALLALQEEHKTLIGLLEKAGDQIETNTVEMQTYNQEIRNGSAAFQNFGAGAKAALGGLNNYPKSFADAWAANLSWSKGYYLGSEFKKGVSSGLMVKVPNESPAITQAKKRILGFADGGIIRKGVAMVGEAGPELLTVGPSGSQVTPLTGSQRAKNVESAGMGGGSNITINVEGGWDNADKIASRVADSLNYIMGSRGVNYAR